MTTSASAAPSTVLRVVEDGGLAALVGTTRATGATVVTDLRDPDVLLFVHELLLATIPETLLDPVAPAALRIPAVLEVLRREIGMQAERGQGLLRGLPTDEA
ncbi:MAG: hypothetical protein WCG26_11465, partial [Chloroflexales bacterium]